MQVSGEAKQVEFVVQRRGRIMFFALETGLRLVGLALVARCAVWAAPGSQVRLKDPCPRSLKWMRPELR